MNKGPIFLILAILLLGTGLSFYLQSPKNAREESDLASSTIQTIPSEGSDRVTEKTVTTPTPNATVNTPQSSIPSVTVLAPVPGNLAAKILTPVALPVSWNKGYQPYDYAGQNPPYFPGKPVAAYIDAGGKKTILKPDQQGVFPRLFLDQSAETSVVLQFPEGTPGEHVAVSTVDGGALNKSGAVEILTLNDQRTVTFEFTLSENLGVSRVSIQEGSQTTFLDFWAGPDNDYHQIAVDKSK